MPLQQGQAWYRSRINAGHDDWVLINHQRLPVLNDENWLPLDILDGVADPDPETDAFEEAATNERAALIRVALDSLYSRERRIIKARYGIDSPEQTLEDIGHELGLTRARIGQIQHDVENRLCDYLNVPRIHPKKSK